VKKIVFLIFPIFMFANEYYYDLDKINFDSQYLEDRYCTKLKKDDISSIFCFKKSISYILENNRTKLKNINKNIEPLLKEYNKINPKDILDIDDPLGSEWNDDIDVKLLAVTNNTYTIKVDEDSYTGGAHGIYGTTYLNFTKNGTSLKLDDLFINGYRDKLLKIAKEEYLKKFKTMDDWFEPKKFKLADEFAITNRGLLFLYNIYEVKAFAFGQTKFIVPYSRLKDIIPPLSPIYGLKDNHYRYFYVPKVGYIKLKYSFVKSGVKIEIDFKNLGYFDKNYLTISFPNIDDIKVTNLYNKGFKSFKLYKIGSEIYNKEKKKAIKSRDLMIEAYNDVTMDRAKIAFVVNKKEFEMLLHTTQIDKIYNKEKHMPKFSSDIDIDQQGYYNYRISIKE